MKLYAIYIGGATKTSLIELHDMRFVIAKSIKDTYDELKRDWWGTPESLHIDCWGELKSADGHNIHLRDHPQEGFGQKLYFVNLGGYDPNEFSELHKNVFVVAPTESKAKVKALKTILDWQSHHKDYLYDVEQAVNLSALAAEKSLYIHLEPTATPEPFSFSCKYHPIGKKVS